MNRISHKFVSRVFLPSDQRSKNERKHIYIKKIGLPVKLRIPIPDEFRPKSNDFLFIYLFNFFLLLSDPTALQKIVGSGNVDEFWLFYFTLGSFSLFIKKRIFPVSLACWRLIFLQFCTQQISYPESLGFLVSGATPAPTL